MSTTTTDATMHGGTAEDWWLAYRALRKAWQADHPGRTDAYADIVWPTHTLPIHAPQEAHR